VLSVTGCQTSQQGPLVHASSQIEVARATGPVVVDGSLDNAVWAKAKPVPFQLAANPAQRKRIGKLEGKGSVRLLHDDKNLYVAFAFDDADVVDLFRRKTTRSFARSAMLERSSSSPWTTLGIGNFT